MVFRGSPFFFFESGEVNKLVSSPLFCAPRNFVGPRLPPLPDQRVEPCSKLDCRAASPELVCHAEA